MAGREPLRLGAPQSLPRLAVMPMELKPPGGPAATPFNLTRFQLGIAGGLVVAVFVLLAQRGFLAM
jgi:hypothetical protein